jgi:hypothetical protein
MGIQSTDIFTTDTVGIEYMAANETWTILPGVFVGSQRQYGIFSLRAQSTLINDGQIFSGGNFGVALINVDNTVTNNAGGSIAGLSGLYIRSGTIDNHGSVAGYHYYGIQFDDPGILNNDGEVFGRFIGVLGYGGGRINNSGVIRSNFDGINLGNGGTMVIDNAAGGIIEGTQAAIRTSSTQISLNNRGTVTGDIDFTLASGNDTVVNRGTIDGDVFLGGGDDFFDSRGGTVTGDIHGAQATTSSWSTTSDTASSKRPAKAQTRYAHT